MLAWLAGKSIRRGLLKWWQRSRFIARITIALQPVKADLLWTTLLRRKHQATPIIPSF